MNSSEPQVLFREDLAPVFLQDKEGASRLSAPLEEPSRAQIPALNSSIVPANRDHADRQPKKKHSTKRQKVFAGSWIDRDTDSYIQNRQLHTRNSEGKRFTRSSVIALMLKERAQDDTFQRSQSILMPIIQETMHQEFRIFTKRFLAIVAKIAYQVGWILVLQLKFVGVVLRKDQPTLHKIEAESETAARVNVANRTPQSDEAQERLAQSLM